MPISVKPKTFSVFLIPFLKFLLNFEYFGKQDQSHSLSIANIINCETCSYLKVEKPIFHATLRQSTC